MKTEIYLVRHGQTEWNIQRRFQGSGDSPLTELGLEQANALSKHLQNTHFDAIYSSPAGRAQTTANMLKSNRNIDITTVKSFEEINLDVWEGKSYDEMEKEQPQLFYGFWNSPDLFNPISGENFSDVGKRTLPALLEIVKNHYGERILIVSHAVAIKSILNQISGLPLNRFWENKLFQTSVSILEFENSVFTILKYGDTAHLNNEQKKINLHII